jgi:hypothetical protein
MFHPWWGRSYYGRGGYFNQQMNMRNGNITNIYRNSNFANGVHGMRVSDFQSGRFGNNIGNYNGRQIGQVGAVQGRMPLAPGNENLRFSDRGIAGTPRANSANTRFFSRQPASAVERIPFAQQQRAFTQQGGPANRAQGGASGQAGQRAIDRPAASAPGRAMERNGQDNGARGNAPAGVQRNDRPGGGSSWQRFGTPGNAQQAAPGNAQQAAPRTQNTQQTPGWNRFGSPGQGASPNNSTPRSNSPQQQRGSAPTQRYNQQQDRPSSPSYSAPQQRSAPSYSAPQQRSAPSYSAPQQRSAPSYSAPQQRSAPSYSAPQQRSAPSYSAPQQRSAPSNSAPRSSGGGGGGARSSGGGRR